MRWRVRTFSQCPRILEQAVTMLLSASRHVCLRRPLLTGTCNIYGHAPVVVISAHEDLRKAIYLQRDHFTSLWTMPRAIQVEEPIIAFDHDLRALHVITFMNWHGLK
jgi:hypothetical protein